MTKGAGSLISAAGHGAAVVFVVLVLGEPKAFEARQPDAIVVELVTPKEVAAAESKPEVENTSSPVTPRQAASPQSATPETSPLQEQQAAGPSAPASPPAAEPRHPAHALLGPPLPQPGALDTRELLALYNMRLPSSGFDAPAATKAKLTLEEVRRVRTHLRRCWQMPAGLAGSATRVVLRLFLNPDGSLAAEPMLIEASASNDGPQVMRAAMAAVEECQPFAFLPAARYEEWKQLDVGFSPREMGSGQGG